MKINFSALKKDDGILTPLRDRWLLTIVVLVVLMGVVYNRTLLLAHDVDEDRHMNYVRLLLQEHRLPQVLSMHPYQEYAGAHAFHPPLYYLILLPFYAGLRVLPDATAWHLVRLVSLLMCLISLPLLYQIALRAGMCRADASSQGDNRVFARLVVAQIALLPMFGMTANMINNDSGALLASTVFFWLLSVKYPEERSLRSALILGLVWGLGALTKSTILLCDGAALLIYLALQDRRLIFSARNWQRLGIALGCLTAIAGWWHVRSLMLYGSFMPVPPSMPSPALPSPDNGILVMMLHENFPAHLRLANWGLFTTMWSQKDWIPASIRDPIYWIMASYATLAIVGFLWKLWHRRKTQTADDQVKLAPKIALWTTCGAFAVNWLAVLQVALFWHWGWAEGGRYLLPTMCGFSILLAYGWRDLLGATRFKYVALAWSLALLVLNGIAIYWLMMFLNPTFGAAG